MRIKGKMFKRKYFYVGDMAKNAKVDVDQKGVEAAAFYQQRGLHQGVG
jgi:hypothetical protein